MKRGTRLLALSAIAALGINAMVGCGGGDNPNSPQTAEGVAPTKAAFLQRANQICREERVDLAQKIAKFERLRAGRRPEPYGDMVHYVLLPTVEEELGAIEELEPPKGELDSVDEVLFPQETALNNTAGTPRVPSVRAAERLFADATEALRAYGLQACAVDAVALDLDK